MTLEQMEHDARTSAVTFDLFRVCVWQRKPSESYKAVRYARRKPGPFLTLWRLLRGVLGV